MTRRTGLIVAAALLAVAARADAQSIESETRALLAAKQQVVAATRRVAELEAASAAAVDDAERTRAAAAAMAARVQAAEADVAAGEARVAIVERLRLEQRARLAARQGAITRLLAALQTMARRPAALSVVQPGAISDMIHVRALLDTVLPIVRQRTARLRAEVAAGRALRARVDQAISALKANRARLDDQRLALARLELRHRARSRELATAALFESDRALAAGEDARDLGALLVTLGAQAKLRDRLAALPGPLPRPAAPGQLLLAAPPVTVDPGASALAYRLPALGQVVTGFGEVSESGVRARGLTIATRAGAQVIAPAAGHVAFAGPFRSWGKIVILDHAGGWTTLVTGLDSLDAAVGDDVDQGGPLGRAPAARPRITIELRRDGMPVDIVPLLIRQ